MREENIKAEKTIDMIRNEYQGYIKQNTLSFLRRKRECIKVIASCYESGAKVAHFNEIGKN